MLLLLLGVACNNIVTTTPTTIPTSVASHFPTPTAVTVTADIKLNTPSAPAETTTPSATPSLTAEPTILLPTQALTVTRPAIDNGLTLFFYGIDGHLYRTDSEATVMERLTTAPDQSEEGAYVFFRPPQVSPDGRWLALNGSWGGAALFDLGEGGSVGVGRGRAMLSPTWSPDSQRFAYLGQNNTLCLVAASDLSERCPFQDVNQLREAVWSPDGSLIAVAAVDPVAADGSCCTGQVLLVNPVDGQAELVGAYVTGFEAVDREVFAWLPDSSGLIIKKTADGRSALFDLTTETMTPFTQPIMDVSPDGRYFLLSTGAISSLDGAILYSLPLGVSDCENDSHKLDSWAWSFDSQRLAFIINCQEKEETDKQWLSVVETMTGSLLWQQALAASMSVKAWTPDDIYLLLQMQTSGLLEDAYVQRLTADGSGTMETVINGFLLEIVPQWGKKDSS